MGGLEPVGHWACCRGTVHTVLTCHLHSWGMFLPDALKCPGEQCLFFVLMELYSWTSIGQGPCALGKLLVCRAQHWGPWWSCRAWRVSQVQGEECLCSRQTGLG